MKKLAIFTVVAAVLLSAVHSSAEARTSFSLNFVNSFAPGYVEHYRPYCCEPVYAAPAPIYAAPAPVFVPAPAPVIAPRVIYVQPRMVHPVPVMHRPVCRTGLGFGFHWHS